MRGLGLTRPARIIGQRLTVGLSSRGSDDGAVAILVAMIFGLGVMLGCAALVVDVGALDLERRQVQNGADAASLALAQQCALKRICDTSTAGQLTDLAGQNAQDGVTDLAAPPCGSVAVTTLPTCVPGVLSPPPLSDCLPVPTLPATAKYVEVRAQTRQSSGSTPSILPPVFAQAILPDSTYRGSTVQSCSRTAWGPASMKSAAVPIAISMCAWEADTGGTAGGTGTYYPGPTGAWPGYGGGGQQSPFPLPLSLIETVVNLTNTSAASTCPTFNGHIAPGGFSWIKDPVTGATGCGVTVSNKAWVQTDTGNNVACDLSPYWKKTIYLPVFDCMVDSATQPTSDPTALTACQSGNGANLWYHVVGFAAFYVSGYHFSGSDERASPVTGLPPCSGSARCVSGWFVRSLVTSTTINDGTTQDLGLRTVLGAG